MTTALLTLREYALLKGATYSTVKRWAHEGMPVVRERNLHVRVDPTVADPWVAALRPMRIRFHREAVVYFIRRDVDGLIKIGFTSDIRQRLHDLRRNATAPFTLLAMVEGDRKTEAAFHRAFAPLLVEREWYRPADHLLAFIEGLKAEERQAANG